MAHQRKNVTWAIPASGPPGTDVAALAVLMDIRDELQALNALLHCSNFQDIPYKLDRIAVSTRRLDKRLATKVPLK